MKTTFDHPIFASQDAILDAVLKVCDTYPDKRNPFDAEFGTCVYDDYKGNHCLIGQVLVDNGLELPEVNHSIGALAEKAGVVQDVADAASYAQSTADMCDRKSEMPRERMRWGDVALEIRDRFGR